MAMSDVQKITRAIRFLDGNAVDQPALAEVAAAVGLSEFHFQRLFRRWAGVSPKRFLQYTTAEHARALLGGSRSVLDVAYESGLSGPGRLHDLTVNVHALTPGEMNRRGEGVALRYGFHESPFGDCLIVVTDRGVCGLGFADPDGRNAVLADLLGRWPLATARRDDASVAETARRIFAGRRPGATLHVSGTNFQVRVWEALLRVPEGALVTYSDLARAVGKPKAARAVGSAVALNPVSLLIPCHRVIRSTGTFGSYRWGRERKKMIVAWESARADGRIAG